MPVTPDYVSRLPLSAAPPHALWSPGAELLSWLQPADALSGAELSSVSAPPVWCRKACSGDRAVTFAAPGVTVGSLTPTKKQGSEKLRDSLHLRDLKAGSLQNETCCI